MQHGFDVHGRRAPIWNTCFCSGKCAAHNEPSHHLGGCLYRDWLPDHIGIKRRYAYMRYRPVHRALVDFMVTE